MKGLDYDIIGPIFHLLTLSVPASAFFPSQTEEKGSRKEERSRLATTGTCANTGQGTTVFWSLNVWGLCTHSWKNPGRREGNNEGSGEP